jgi:hypothetical protein
MEYHVTSHFAYVDMVLMNIYIKTHCKPRMGTPDQPLDVCQDAVSSPRTHSGHQSARLGHTS